MYVVAIIHDDARGKVPCARHEDTVVSVGSSASLELMFPKL